MSLIRSFIYYCIKQTNVHTWWLCNKMARPYWRNRKMLLHHCRWCLERRNRLVNEVSNGTSPPEVLTDKLLLDMVSGLILSLTESFSQTNAIDKTSEEDDSGDLPKNWNVRTYCWIRKDFKQGCRKLASSGNFLCCFLVHCVRNISLLKHHHSENWLYHYSIQEETKILRDTIA